MGVVSNCVKCMPNLLEYFNTNYPSMTVKCGSLLNTKEVETLKFNEYKSRVYETYLNGMLDSKPSVVKIDPTSQRKN